MSLSNRNIFFQDNDYIVMVTRRLFWNLCEMFTNFTLDASTARLDLVVMLLLAAAIAIRRTPWPAHGPDSVLLYAEDEAGMKLGHAADVDRERIDRLWRLGPQILEARAGIDVRGSSNSASLPGDTAILLGHGGGAAGPCR